MGAHPNIYPKVLQIHANRNLFSTFWSLEVYHMFLTSAAYSAFLHLYGPLFSAFWSLAIYKKTYIYFVTSAAYSAFLHLYGSFCGMVMRPAREAGYCGNIPDVRKNPFTNGYLR